MLTIRPRVVGAAAAKVVYFGGCRTSNTMASNFNFKFTFVNTEDGDYVLRQDAEGKAVLEKRDQKEEEEDNEEVDPGSRRRSSGWADEIGRPGSPRCVLVPQLVYLPYPPESWPKTTSIWTPGSDGGSTLSIYTMFYTAKERRSPSQRQSSDGWLILFSRRRWRGGRRRERSVASLPWRSKYHLAANRIRQIKI